MFLLTFEFLDLQLAAIFLSTAMALPLTSEINIETVEDNGLSRSSCLKHTVPRVKVHYYQQEEIKKRGKQTGKTRVALLSSRPTSKQPRVYPVRYR